MTRLTDLIPLRTSAIFDKFRTAEYLPLIYGKAVVKPIQIDRKGLKFVIADHACRDVLQVIRNEKPTAGFAWSVEDNITILELVNPLATTEILWAEVIGKEITNPAKIIQDFAAPTQDLSQFERDCANNQIELSGAITEPDKYKKIIDGIIADCVGWWTPAMDSFAQLIWVAPQEQVPEHFYRTLSTTLTANQVFSILEYNYNVNHANKQPQSSIRLKAKTEYQAPLETYTARWVKLDSVALTLAKKRLAYLSVARIKKTFTTISPVRLGVESLGGIVISAKISGTNEREIITEIQQTAPTIAIVRITKASDLLEAKTLGIEFDNGILTITVLDDADNPIVGAEVTVDTLFPQITDGFGVVRFTEIQLGDHVAVIRATGFADLKYEFSL